MTRLQKRWPKLVDELGEKHPGLRSDLLDSWPEDLTDTTCVIGFDAEFSGEISEVKRLGYSHVHGVVVGELHRQVRLDFKIASQPVRWSHERKTSASPTQAPSANLRSWENNQSVRHILEIFHGDVRDVQM